MKTEAGTGVAVLLYRASVYKQKRWSNVERELR